MLALPAPLTMYHIESFIAPQGTRSFKLHSARCKSLGLRDGYERYEIQQDKDCFLKGQTFVDDGYFSTDLDRVKTWTLKPYMRDMNSYLETMKLIHDSITEIRNLQ